MPQSALSTTDWTRRESWLKVHCPRLTELAENRASKCIVHDWLNSPRIVPQSALSTTDWTRRESCLKVHCPRLTELAENHASKCIVTTDWTRRESCLKVHCHDWLNSPRISDPAQCGQPKNDAKSLFCTLRHPSPVIFATTTLVAFVLFRNSRLNFHCYTHRDWPMPTQKPDWARKWQLRPFSRDFWEGDYIPIATLSPPE